MGEEIKTYDLYIGATHNEMMHSRRHAYVETVADIHGWVERLHKDSSINAIRIYAGYFYSDRLLQEWTREPGGEWALTLLDALGRVVPDSKKTYSDFFGGE